ncbi:MAG: hypothetical protein KKI08_10380, partial [Armatimonadetes bacterium]|nr:hypothetical protein [Armatimonadota bacterium]
RFSLDQLQAYLARFRALYGAPLIANSRGWERWGMWTGQEYLPPLPSEEHFTDAGRITRAADGRGMVMLSGYRWTIEKQQPDGSVHSSQERFDREVSRYAVCDAAGRPIIHTSDKADDWHGQKWAMLCRSTPFATDTIVDTAEYCVRRGYPVVHFDQEVSGAYQAGVCGSRAHGHPPGHGRYVHEGLVGLYRRLRERCGPANPDFVLSMEEPNELYLPYLNLCQCRPFGLTTEWPAVAPMTRTVPLFSFLYHDYLIQWAAFYPWKSAGRPEVSTAKGFAAGLMPGLQPYDNTLPAEGTTRYSGFFRRCMDLYLGPAREYLVFGRMLKAPPLNIPQRTLSLGKDRGETTVPAVWHSLWQLEDGRRGLVLLNPETEAHTLTFDLTTLTPAGATVRLVAPDAAAREIRAAGQVTVEAGDAALIEIIPERA